MTQRVEKAARWLLEFTAYSFIGWVYETVLTSVVWGKFAERGVLHLPLLPIYGFCSLLLILLLGRIKNIPLLFFLGEGVITALELAASYILESILGCRLWDYSDWALNFDGRISLFSSIIFGILCVLLVRVLHPAAEKIYQKAKPRTIIISAAICLIFILADLIILCQARSWF